jgi:hypothetical protein
MTAAGLHHQAEHCPKTPVAGPGRPTQIGIAESSTCGESPRRFLGKRFTAKPHGRLAWHGSRPHLRTTSAGKNPSSPSSWLPTVQKPHGPRRCRAAVESRTGRPMFNTSPRFSSTASHPFYRGLLHLNRGPTAREGSSAIWIQQSGGHGLVRLRNLATAIPQGHV